MVLWERVSAPVLLRLPGKQPEALPEISANAPPRRDRKGGKPGYKPGFKKGPKGRGGPGPKGKPPGKGGKPAGKRPPRQTDAKR